MKKGSAADRYLPDPSHEWEKSRSNSSGICKELECIQNDQGEQSSRSSGFSVVDKTYSRTASLRRSTSCSAVIEEMTPEYNVVAVSMVTKEVEGDASGRSLQYKSESDIKSSCRQDSDEKGMKQIVGSGGVFIYSPTRTLKEVMRDDLKEEYISYMAETPRAIGSAKEDNDRDLLFEEQRRKIIKLRDECNIPLVHRTYLFLLIQGGLSDSVYIEIKLR
ncbi:unnamed protein product [Lactuca saligna]|uniref:NPK1-activating kinesin-like protein C-terminal domain-containing protein n=1 Tax=Lactuca saligna TaxID=75948 RepID=A0AA35YBF0_LACSI|nr:unnamed protein product [Lactuca saligna]